MVGLLGQGISPSQGLYLHRTAQHRKMRTFIHASGIWTHDPSVPVFEQSKIICTSAHMAIGTSCFIL